MTYRFVAVLISRDSSDQRTEIHWHQLRVQEES